MIADHFSNQVPTHPLPYPPKPCLHPGDTLADIFRRKYPQKPVYQCTITPPRIVNVPATYSILIVRPVEITLHKSKKDLPLNQFS
jgi:hypothetical protein